MMNNVTRISSILLNSFVLSNIAVAASVQQVDMRLLSDMDFAKPVTVERSLIDIANTGDADAQLVLAKIYESQNNLDRETEWYRKSALNGNAEAQFQLGLLYIDGELVDGDHETGMFWMDQAAQQGHFQAKVVQESMESEEFSIGC